MADGLELAPAGPHEDAVNVLPVAPSVRSFLRAFLIISNGVNFFRHTVLGFVVADTPHKVDIVTPIWLDVAKDDISWQDLAGPACWRPPVL